MHLELCARKSMFETWRSQDCRWVWGSIVVENRTRLQMLGDGLTDKHVLSTRRSWSWQAALPLSHPTGARARLLLFRHRLYYSLDSCLMCLYSRAFSYSTIIAKQINLLIYFYNLLLKFIIIVISLLL